MSRNSPEKEDDFEQLTERKKVARAQWGCLGLLVIGGLATTTTALVDNPIMWAHIFDPYLRFWVEMGVSTGLWSGVFRLAGGRVDRWVKHSLSAFCRDVTEEKYVMGFNIKTLDED
jgi:hypothetical protein